MGAVQDGDDPHRDALSAWFSPEIAAALLAARQGQEPRHLTGEPARFAAQFGWQRLSRLLEWHPLEPARLHLVRGGETLDPATFRKQSKDGTTRLIAGALANQLDRGATLVLNHAHELDPALCALADAIAEELQVRCGANIYASLGDEAGLALHWDEHDVFVLQIAGRKHWRVHAAVEGEPFGLPPVDAAPAWEGVLEAGDVLHVPRGWAHSPAPLGEPSLHVTLSLTDPEFVTRDDDLPGPGDAKQLARPVFALPELMRADPADWTCETRFRLASYRRLGFAKGEGGAMMLHAGKAALPCPGAAIPALRELCSARETSLARLEALAGSDSAADLRAVLAMLVKFGIAYARNT
ncbi:MAG: cupin domain-containing protein [Sphingomonadaceae bacterium]